MNKQTAGLVEESTQWSKPRRKTAPRRAYYENSTSEEEGEESGEDEQDDDGQDVAGRSSEGPQIEVEDDEDSEEDEDMEQEEDDDDIKEPEEDELSASESPSTSPPPRQSKASPLKPKLKLTLRLPIHPQNLTPTPSDEQPLPPSSGRRASMRKIAPEIESEDDGEEEDSSRSASLAGPSRMTHRQAALKGFVEPTEHVALEETTSNRKKKHLNETELALKREETARKRKNLSVKKLEEEKVDTINRLLKKKTSRKGRAAATAVTAADPDDDGEGEVDEAVTAAPTPPPQPTLFRWISSSKPDAPPLSFSVPVNFLPPDSQQIAVPAPLPQEKKAFICDYAGCSLPRKYKLVKDPARGGCGMEHLKALQAMAV